jgi:hypothetical protein
MSAQHLTVVRYPPGKDWVSLETNRPTWEQASEAVQRMDDDEYPWIRLSWKNVGSSDEDEEAFCIMGGRGAGFALFEFMGRWQFEEPLGSDEEVRLWQSDQGYYCKRKNIIGTVGDALKLAQVYFETGSYEALERASAVLRNRQRNR